MATGCKLYYMNDYPLDPKFPLRAISKVATDQKPEIIRQVEDFGQVNYHNGSSLPTIKNVKNRILTESLLPSSIPDEWAVQFPKTLGFHMHENLEITLVTEGKILYIAEGNLLEVHAGEAIFFGSYIPHGWIVDRGNSAKVIELTFKADFFEQFQIPNSPVSSLISTGKLKFLHIPKENGETSRRILTVESELSHPSFGNRFFAALELNLILLTLLRKTVTFTEETSVSNPIISEARAYIAEHLTENPSLPEIAKAVFVSPQHLSYLFKKQVGIGIADYINRQKILLCTELLSDSELSMQDIVQKSGFMSRSNFYRIFKEYYGIPPRQMRDALIKEKRPDN